MGTRRERVHQGIRAWIAQSVEHQTFNLRVQGSSPCSGVMSFNNRATNILYATEEWLW